MRSLKAAPKLLAKMAGSVLARFKAGLLVGAGLQCVKGTLTSGQHCGIHRMDTLSNAFVILVKITLDHVTPTVTRPIKVPLSPRFNRLHGAFKRHLPGPMPSAGINFRQFIGPPTRHHRCSRSVGAALTMIIFTVYKDVI